MQFGVTNGTVKQCPGRSHGITYWDFPRKLVHTILQSHRIVIINVEKPECILEVCVNNLCLGGSSSVLAHSGPARSGVLSQFYIIVDIRILNQ